MKINVFPKISGELKLPGVLSALVHYDGTAVCTGTLPQAIDAAEREGALDVNFILGNVCPINLGGINRAAEIIADRFNPMGMRFVTPDSLHGWIKALILEHDYKSKELTKVQPRGYSIDVPSRIFDNGDIRVEYLPDLSGWADYILRFSFDLPVYDFYFCEVANITNAPPDLLRNANHIVLNFGRFPSLPGARGDFDNIIEWHMAAFRRLRVASVFMPTPSGILWGRPHEAINSRELLNAETCVIMDSPVTLGVVHDRELLHYRQASLPVYVQDDQEKCKIQLGMDLGTALHQRIKSKRVDDISRMIMPCSSYAKVFACVDLLEQAEARSFEIICGQSMRDAIEHFKKMFQGTYRRQIGKARVLSAKTGEIGKHILDDALEVTMIPYPAGSDNFMAQIRDLDSGELLIYTEQIDDEAFLEKSLEGVETLVVGVAKSDADVVEQEISHLKSLQYRAEVPRLMVIYPGGTKMSALGD